MISEFTYAAVKDELVCRQLDKLVVKGKSLPVTVYELVADKKDLGSNETLGKAIQDYNDALKLYFDRQWIQAALKFERVLEVWPDDGPSKLYVSRAQHYMHTPPGKDWNGVFTMTTK
jgi:adenylate cyclase